MITCILCEREMSHPGLHCDECREEREAGQEAAPDPRPQRSAGPQTGQSEAEVQAEIVAYLELHGWKVWKTSAHAHAKGVDRGVPDLICLRDRLAFVEVKRPGGRVRPEQRAFLEAARAAGAWAIIARGVGDVQTLTEAEAA